MRELDSGPGKKLVLRVETLRRTGKERAKLIGFKAFRFSYCTMTTFAIRG